MSDRKADPVTKFARAVAAAGLLPAPRYIARTIMASSPGAHNGLRAASYDGKVRGGAPSSHPERLAEERADQHPSTELDNLRRLSKASEKAVDAVAVLLAECADVGYDADDYGWDDALKDAGLLLEPQHPDPEEHPDHDPTDCECISLLEAADLVGREVGRWVDRYHAAVVEIRTIHRHYLPKPATRWQQIRESGLRADEICDICASITPPVYVAVRNKAFLLCRHCNDLRLEGGERPAREVKQAYHHGTQLDYRRALSRWLDDCAEERRAHHA